MRKHLLFLLLFSILNTGCGLDTTPKPETIVITEVVVPQVNLATSTPEPLPIATQTSQAEATPTIEFPIITPTPQTRTERDTLMVKSVDVMKWSQDVLRNQPEDQFMAEIVAMIKEAGATHVAISVPYDSPPDLPSDASVEFTRRWVKAIREGEMNVWFRQSPLAFKGFYEVHVHSELPAHIDLIATYIQTNPDLFQAGDLFTPIPEPQVDRVYGINCFAENCMFRDVNQLALFMRTATTEFEAAFADIGLGGQITVGRWGLDGFILWGDRNSDWEGKPDTLTNGRILAEADGNTICIDHYFPTHTNPHEEFAKIRQYFPDTELWLCEWGPTQDQSPEYVEQVFQAAFDNKVIGFNWWQSGPGGQEALFESGLDNQPQTSKYYEILQKYFNSN